MEQKQLIAFFFVCAIIFIITIIAIILFFAQYRKRKVEYENEQKTLRMMHELTVQNAKIEMQNETLVLIGKELHDNIGQLLTVAKIHTNSLVKSLAGNPKIIALDDVLNKTITEVKSLSKSLDTSRIKNFGFGNELKIEVERINKLQICTVALEMEEIEDIPNKSAIILFRIIQEFLANSIKYSQCSTIIIRIKKEAEKLSLFMQDNGQGFIMQQQPMGSGVYNILSRIQLLNGTNICFESKLNIGTTLSFYIPYQI